MDDIFSNSSTGSMANIYLDKNLVNSTIQKIKDASSNIESDINNINSLIEDLKTYWVGSESKIFIRKLNEYNNFFTQIAKAYQASSDSLQNCYNNYLELDKEFSKGIE